MRKIAITAVLVAAHFISGQAQLVFNTRKSTAKSTATAASNGILVSVAADTTNDFSYYVSDAFSSTAATDVFVTTVCASGPVDIGPVTGTSTTFTTALAAGAATDWKTDIQSAYLPGAITTGTTPAADQYYFTAGQTIRYTLDPSAQAAFQKFDIKDGVGNSLQGTTCNSAGTATSGSGTACKTYTKGTAVSLGLEVLNKGQAVFCVQTLAQFAKSNSCDGKTTTTATCTATASGKTFTAATKCTAKIWHGGCSATCPTGSYAYTTDTITGCVDCYAALSSGFCDSTQPPASSGSLLRVGQISAMFIGLYFVLFG